MKDAKMVLKAQTTSALKTQYALEGFTINRKLWRTWVVGFINPRTEPLHRDLLKDPKKNRGRLKLQNRYWSSRNPHISFTNLPGPTHPRLQECDPLLISSIVNNLSIRSVGFYERCQGRRIQVANDNERYCKI